MQMSSATALSRASGDGAPNCLTKTSIWSGLASALARYRKNSRRAGPSVPRLAARKVCSSGRTPSASAAHSDRMGRNNVRLTTDNPRTTREGMASSLNRGWLIADYSFRTSNRPEVKKKFFNKQNLARRAINGSGFRRRWDTPRPLLAPLANPVTLAAPDHRAAEGPLGFPNGLSALVKFSLLVGLLACHQQVS